MVTYKILQVNTAEAWASIRYSKDGYADYFVQVTFGDGVFNEDELHVEAQERVTEAIAYWNRLDSDTPVTLATDTGTIGNVTVAEHPEYDPMTHEVNVVKTVTGNDIAYTYNLVPLGDEVISSNIRFQRDDLLHHTDSFALADRTLSTAMQTYRQQLRDITDQDGFPNNVVWPTEPID